MGKVVTVFVCAMILIMFGCAVVMAAQSSAHDLQKQIEAVMQANEGGMFVKMSRVDRGRIARAIVRHSGRFALDPWLILGVIRAESAGKSDAQNGACIGLMQINEPIWGGDDIGDLRDIDSNVYAGSYILRYYLNQYNGNIDKALLRYSGYSRKRGREYLRKAKAFMECVK